MGDYRTSLEKDALSRNRIVSEMDENFFVEAGAGSGKTTMLVKRMVAMVEAGIDIRKICAITFTKAAAGEFYSRFQRMLIERSSPGTEAENICKPGSLPCPTDKTRERCSEALQNIDLCFMGTIDAFCSMVLSEHPSEAGIPSDADNVSDEAAAAVYRQQYVKICSGEYGEELRSCAKAFQALHRDAQEVFAQGIAFIMNNRNVHFNYRETGAVDIDHDFADEKKDLLNALQCLVDHPELKYEGNKGSREAWDRISDSYYAVRRRWSSNYSNVLYALKSLKDIRLIPEAIDRHGASLGPLFVPGGKGKKLKWYEFASGKDAGLYDRLRKLQYDISMTFLVKCIPVMEQALRDRGSLTFFDYLYYLRNMLKKDAEGDGKLIRYIYDRHSYYLIDEFQDTNPLQAEVFFYLSAEHPVPQWSECVPRKGSLFIVGDPKQSIYRFRSADVRSFIKVKRLFEANGGAILSLSRNFRSTRMLCEYFNRVFTALLPDDTENQSKFELIPLPDPTEDEFQGVFTYQAYTGQAEQEHPDKTDSVRIADIIERLVHDGRYQLRAENEKEPRPVRYSDFMVITYGKRKLGPILAELSARDIPAKVEGDVPFTETEALCEISRVFAAVTDADDLLALYGALTGKLLALTNEDLLKYRACGGSISLKAEWKPEGCTDSAVLHAAEQIGKLKKLYSSALRLSPAALFSRIMNDFRVYQTVSSENMEVVYYALELLRNAEKAGKVISLKDGAAFLDSLIAGESGEERCLILDAEKDCVHMANLHKVKGLEAPIVILAAASSSGFPVAYRINHEDREPEGYLFSLESERDRTGRSTSYFHTDDYADEKEDETEALKAEGQRLIYVAATRARNALILCNSIKKTKTKETSNSMWSPIMESGLPDLFELLPDVIEKEEDRTVSVDAAGLYNSAEEGSVFKNRSAEAASFKTENPSRMQVISKLADTPERTEPETVQIEEGSNSADNGEMATGHRFPALLGTMTHKLMEMLVTTKNQLVIESAVAEIIREYRTPESQSYESQLSAALVKVAETMRNGGYVQTNGLPQDMLGTLLSADEVYCEVPFCYVDDIRDDRTVWNGIIDVIYCVDGQWHIVDYKTNVDGNDLDLKYQGQLEAYQKALKAVMGAEADAMTYHIDI